MKLFIGLLTLAISFSSVASSGETKTFVYDGSQNSIELILRGEKTRTEYRVEQRHSTCYRQQVVGYRTICTGGGYGPRPYPRPYPGPRYCYRQPVYRSVAYPCMQTIRIPYEVKDYDVDARVLLDVEKISQEITPGETFKVSLSGDKLSLEVKGSKKFLINLKKEDVRENINGSVKYIDAFYAIELIEAAPIVLALKFDNISMSDGVLNLGSASAEGREYAGLSLKVVRSPVLGSDTVLFDRALTANESSVQSEGLTVDFSSLGISLTSGRYSITAKSFLKVNGRLLNKSQFPELEDSRTLIYKIR